MRNAAWAAVVAGLLLVLLFGAFLLRESRIASAAVRSAQEIYEPATTQSALLATSVSDMQRGVTFFVLTGDEADLRPYVEGSRRSELALQQLDVLLAGDPALMDLTSQVTRDRARWIADVAQPTIDFRRAGEVQQAVSLLDSAAAKSRYVNLQANTATLQAVIYERGIAAFELLTARTYGLGWAVLISVALLIAALIVFILVTRRRLLEPLDDLRLQIRAVARTSDHTHTIEAYGPKELRELGSDVEELRRQLVSEIDEARSARQALDQKAPVVAAIRAELAARSPVVAVPGLQVAGELQPAEGVLAGDWWDCTGLPTGETAVVVADISGHGAEAGIAAMRLKQAIVHDLNAGLDIDAIARSAAEVFKDYPDRFASVAAVCIDPASGAVRYINAGHHEPLVLDRDGAVIDRLATTGPILSWLGGDWAIGHGSLGPGQSLLLYSDGLIESHDEDGAELGEDRLESWLATMPDDQREPADLVPWLIGAARQRAVDWKRDDVTVVAIARPPE